MNYNLTAIIIDRYQIIIKFESFGLCQIIRDLLISPTCVMGPSVIQLQHLAYQVHLHQVCPDFDAIGLVIEMHRIQSLPLGYFNL